MASAAGKETPIALADIVRFYNPNAMGFLAKCRHYLDKVAELLWENPRESNTEGGLFPAIFGTVMLIFLMAVACFPLGVLAGIYLGEYAKEGFLVRVVRIPSRPVAEARTPGASRIPFTRNHFRGPAMPEDSSVRGSKESPVGAASERPGGKKPTYRPCRPRRGVPALLDWIEEAEAVNRPVVTRLLVAALIAAFITLLLVRFGCTP